MRGGAGGAEAPRRWKVATHAGWLLFNAHAVPHTPGRVFLTVFCLLSFFLRTSYESYDSYASSSYERDGYTFFTAQQDFK